MSVRLCCIFLCAMTISTVSGAGSSVCPESKKLYPGDCRLFYKCVPTPESAQAYVWVPSRCTAGLVYAPRLESCVIPREGWECKQEEADEDFDENSFYSLKESTGVEDGMKMTDYPVTSTVQNGIYMSEFKDDDKSSKINPVSSTAAAAMETNSVPLSAVNIPPLDPIKAQMQRLTQLINSLKATNDAPGPDPGRQPLVPVGYSALPKPLDLNFPLKQENPHFTIQEPNLLPAQIYKITAQLISQTQEPTLKRVTHQSVNTETPNFSPDQVVSELFQKYLANATSLKGGEFVKTFTNKNIVYKQKLAAQQYKTRHCHIGDRLAHSQDCTKYYICKNHNSLISFTCPPMSAFNGKRKVCDVHEYKKCVLKVNDFNELIIQGNKKEGNCEEEGRFPDPTSRYSYLICLRKDAYKWWEHKVKCPRSTEFCEHKKICLPKPYCHQ